MKQFVFTIKEIDTNKCTSKDWHNFVRRREAEMIFSLFPNKNFGLGLELGAGDGGQSITISKYCRYLICTEFDEQSHSWIGQKILERDLPNVDYQLCDAHDLSKFKDRSFDLIFSSNVLEHLQDEDKCLSECMRVLKDEGIMLHTMPNRIWKTTNFLLSPLKIRIPRVHGTSSNHLTEFFKFGYRSWKKIFELNNFVVQSIIGLPFYVGHSNSFISIIKLGNLARLPASYLYVVTKKQGT